MKRRRSLLLAAVPMAGCSLLLGEGYTTSSPPGSEEAPGDEGGSPLEEAEAGVASDGAESSEAATEELLANGRFEVDGSECGPPWQRYGASPALGRSAGREGFACRACRSSGSSLDWYGLKQVFTPSLGPGAYRLTGWHHVIGGTKVNRCEIFAHVRRSGGGLRQVVAQGCDPDREEWQQLSVRVVVEQGEELVDVTASAEAPQGGCFDVDDVSLVPE